MVIFLLNLKDPLAVGSLAIRKAAEPQNICSKKVDKAGKVQRTAILQINMCLYFGAPHLFCELDNIYYKYQRCSAPENASLILPTPCVIEPKNCITFGSR